MALPAVSIQVDEPSSTVLGNRWTFTFRFTDSAGAAVDPPEIYISMRIAGQTTNSISYSHTSVEVTNPAVGTWQVVEHIPVLAGTWLLGVASNDGSGLRYAAAVSEFEVGEYPLS